ncbi:MAG: type III secretion system chaperone [Parachlamydiales bacterium]|jgi:hypothetical protein
MLERHLEKLAKEWEVKRGFSTSTPGVFEIPLGDDLSIVLTAIDSGFSLYTVLGSCTVEKKGDFFLKLLASCNLGESTRGAIFSLDEKENLVLSQWVRNAPQYRDFYEIIEDYVEIVDTWRAVLELEVLAK